MSALTTSHCWVPKSVVLLWLLRKAKHFNDQFMTTDDRWWQHQMPVRALRHDKLTVQFSKSRGLSGSVSLSSETIRKHLLCGLFLSNTASVLVIFQNLC